MLDEQAPSAATELRPAPGPDDGRSRARIGLARLRALPRPSALRVAVAALIEHDLDRGAGFCWMVVAFGCGAGLYLVLPQEPWFPALALAAAGLAALATIRRRAGHRAAVLSLAAAVAAGMLAGKIEAWRVAAPRLDRERTVVVTGWVAEAETTASGGTRMIVRVARMESRGRAIAEPPALIAATAQRGRDAGAAIGAGVTFMARLKPPDGPVLPGGYDFARRAYFDGRGAAGYVLGRVRAADAGPAPTTLVLKAAIADLRHRIAVRIRAALPGASGAIAAALTVGETRAIPAEANEALRASGLTHIISISGLHMTLVGGGVFAAVRYGLALVPVIALRRPVKKWAAVAAFAAVTFYLLLSGGGVATERSWVMFVVGLVAILADRPVVSQRNVAFAALALMAIEPHTVVEPSFLMSFLAVLALVSAWRGLSARPPDPASAEASGIVAELVRRGFGHVIGMAAASFVAGLATAPVVAAEFHRAAPYGMIANMIVLPIVGTVIMPFACLAMLAIPFGLEIVPLTVMGWGIDAMLAVARMVSAWPGGQGLIGRIHPASLPLAIAGILWFCLWTTPLRRLGLVALAAALAVAPFAARPDILVGQGGAPIAVRAADGRLAILDARANRFTTATWLAAGADPRSPTAARDLAGDWRCDPLGCAFRDGHPGRAPRILALVRDPRAFEEDCRLAAIVVTTLDAPPGCAASAVVIDRKTLARTGALTLDWPRPPASTGHRPSSEAEPGDRGDQYDHQPASALEPAGPTPPQATITASLPAGRRPWHAAGP
ncbi:ComEC/Rec2 family competence protein [Prosthecodimorpha staleyi]|uniref:ComEC family competence protein n=1 Tax=Prosthecodimorpha staleyi TaxID=2840188 RepID=A0A947D0Y2_9HYPH|nr:ComEC/Rec2 family competence protein [Prosthecodimorpha staleyi]MBT9288324.1 ComEC family competence protein [Prosthecodimorpha staleyi]